MTNEEIRKMPKVELHAHLNGSISLKTIEKLLSENSKVKDRVAQDFVLKQPTTMEEVFKMFPLIQMLTETKEALKTATLDVIQEFNDDNVVYLELRTTPKNTEFMNKKEYVMTIIEAIQECSKLYPIVTTLILSIDRRQNLDEAEETVKIAINDDSNIITGVELSGNPILDGTKFIPALQKARNSGLGVSVHLAEMAENSSEILEFLKFCPDRIGHGTFLHTNEEFVRIMENKKIPLEICLTSNTLCKTTLTVADSHFPFWAKKGVKIAICTDDKGLMNDCTLSQEFQKAADAFSLSLADLQQITMNSFDVSFASRKLPASKSREISEKLGLLN